MDYGSWLKAQGVRNNSQSRHYKKQSPLKGSVREVRGQILKALTGRAYTEGELRKVLAADERFTPAVQDLIAEKMIVRSRSKLHLTK